MLSGIKDRMDNVGTSEEDLYVALMSKFEGTRSANVGSRMLEQRTQANIAANGDRTLTQIQKFGEDVLNKINFESVNDFLSNVVPISTYVPGLVCECTSAMLKFQPDLVAGHFNSRKDPIYENKDYFKLILTISPIFAEDSKFKNLKKISEKFDYRCDEDGFIRHITQLRTVDDEGSVRVLS